MKKHKDERMEAIMDTLIEFLPLLVVLLAVIVVGGYTVYVFINRPTTEQIEKVKEWLLYAVTEAEKELGGGTGQIKLRYVYDMFVEKFPSLARVITFNSFSGMVDEALTKFKGLLKTNAKVDEYVNGPRTVSEVNTND